MKTAQTHISFARSDSEDDALGEITIGESSLLGDTTLSEEKVEEEEEEEFDDEREAESVMNWDFNDFAITDHRLQLYCDLSLFRFLWHNEIISDNMTEFISYQGRRSHVACCQS